MAFLQLALLGGFDLTVAGQAVHHFRSQREIALLAYLAVEAHQPQPRERLASLLWPAKPAAVARQNLRQTLTNLRTQLRAGQQTEPILLAEPTTIQFNPASAATIDVTRFRAAIATSATHQHTALAACTACLAQLAAAVALYRGPLLANFALSDSGLFEEWLLLTREQLHHEALTVLSQLSRIALQQADWTQTLHYARRQVELDPFQEEAHRQILQALAAQGERSGALAHFDSFRLHLATELGVEPSRETLTLLEQIRTGTSLTPVVKEIPARFAPTAPPACSPPPSGEHSTQRHDWDGTVTTGLFVGREAELASIRSWLQAGAPVITIFGLAGVGKSTLAQMAARDQAAHFPVIIWRSLLNALPLSALLTHWLTLLGAAPLPGQPADPERLLNLLFNKLRRQRCLLVLDSVESIMLQDRGGRFRPGYEAYGDFFRRMALEDHQSTLLLTSREQPQTLLHLAEATPGLHALTVAGLSPIAGQALLRSYGLSLATSDATQLVQRFSGNPLILKFVANTVQELFNGDLSAFLAEETPVYGDIRDLFDQYRLRIPYIEKVILMWLAIHREPLPIAKLRASLRPPVSTSTFLEAIHSLQRRALIEQTPTGFTVSNVVMTIMIDYLLQLMSQEIIDQTVGVLNHYRLIEEEISEDLRQSQIRVLVTPLLERLGQHFGQAGLVVQLQQMLVMAQQPSISPGYLADNLGILLAHANGAPLA